MMHLKGEPKPIALHTFHSAQNVLLALASSSAQAPVPACTSCFMQALIPKPPIAQVPQRTTRVPQTPTSSYLSQL